MKSIRRSLKDQRSPPSSAGSNHNGQYASAHHVLGNGYGPASGSGSGNGAAPVTTLPPARGKAQGKTPPKKVIRAVTSYRSRSPQELSFESGDFFHVMGERFDGAGEVEWFDAANPATGARGLVPANCFQVLGRNEKENRATSVMSSGSGQTLSPPLSQSNQFQGGASTSSQQSTQSQSQYQPSGDSPSSSSFPHRSLPNQAKGPQQRPRTQPLYGIVQYDFRAERPDELDARRGENIIVIAQSNHEWFVAKPIGRLGGPGLIPVSFVAISDTTTGEPLAAEKVKDMIESGMVPPVEEWKKQTAEYKQASIPLGRFDFSNQSTPTLASTSSTSAGGQRTSTPYGLQQGQGGNNSATSLGSSQGGGGGRPPSNGNKAFSPNSSTSSFNKQQGQSHQPSSSVAQQYQQGYQEKTPQPPQQPYSNSQFASTSTSSFGNQPNGHGQGFHPSTSTAHQQNLSHADDYYGSGGGDPQNEEGQNEGEGEDFYDKYGVVTSASVESFHSEEENFWFHLRVNFDQSGYSLILYRLYDDFYEFQCALMDEHPVEAGKALSENSRPGDVPKRIIPKMPGPVENVDEVVCAQRVDDLTVYLRGLCGLPDYLKADQLFYEFLVPRPGDVEASVPDETMSRRWEAEKTRDRERDRELAHSAHGTRGPKKLDEEVEEYLDQMGNVTNGMGRTNLGSSQGPSAAAASKPGNLPPLNTSTNSSNNGPFTPGYSMMSSSTGGASNHARHQSHSDRPDSRADSQGGYSNGGPLSAGSGINFTSPFAQNNNSQSSERTVTPATAATSNATSPPPFVKIKIFHRNTDDLIAIRVPPNINLSSLLDKVRERLGGEVNHVRYRDEGNMRLSQGQMQSLLNLPGGGRLVELRDDAELDDWIKSAQRLVAYVD